MTSSILQKEEYLKEEMRNLRQEYIHAQNEVKRIASIPLMIGHFLEGIDPNTCIVAPTSGQNYYVRPVSTLYTITRSAALVDPWSKNFIDGRPRKIKTVCSRLPSQAFSFAGRCTTTRIWFIYSGFSSIFRGFDVFGDSTFSRSQFSENPVFREIYFSVVWNVLWTVQSWLKTSQMWHIPILVDSILRNKVGFQTDTDSVALSANRIALWVVQTNQNLFENPKKKFVKPSNCHSHTWTCTKLLVSIPQGTISIFPKMHYFC